MTVAYVAFVVGVAVVLAVAAALVAGRITGRGPVATALDRLRRIRAVVVAELGRYLGALAILLAGAAAAVVVCWPLGRMLRRFTDQVDAPILRFTQRHVSHHGAWHHLNTIATQMGNRPVIKIVCLVAAVGFGVVWAVQRRAWWVPTLVMAAAFGFEKFGQTALKDVADRPKVALPAFGNFPSGGCARLVCIYGMVFFLVLLTWPRIERRWRITGWTVLAVLAFVEGYTRIFLIKHWAMDVVGGWLFGALLLGALAAAASCFALDPADGRTRGGSPGPGAVRR